MYSEHSNKYEVNQICRVCLSTETNYIDIFSSTSNISSISTAIMECAPITILETDTLPHAICTCCLEKLEIAYNFRKLCIQTDQTLRNNAPDTIVKDETITPITKIETDLDISDIKIEQNENSCAESLPDNDQKGITTPKKMDAKKLEKQQPDANSSTDYLSDNGRISDDNGEGITTPKKRNVKKRTKKQPQTKKQPRIKKQSETNSYTECLSDNDRVSSDSDQKDVIAPKKRNVKKRTKKQPRKERTKKEPRIKKPPQIKLKREKKKIVVVRESDGLFHCKNCAYTCKNERNFIVHISSHTGEKVFCDKCNKSYNHIYQLNTHMIGVHGERKYSCEICGLTFPFSHWLKSHQNSHLTVKLFKCDICSKEFKWKKTLDKHQVTHTDVRPYACTECEQSFKRKDHLRVHIQKHFGKRYKCDLCSSTFISRANLKYHIGHNCTRTQMKLSGEIYRPFKCETCSKEFRWRKDLELHATVHSDVRSFFCDECGNGFKRKDHLAKHAQRTHGKRFKCDLCLQEFLFGADLNSHILSKCSGTRL